MPVTLDKLVKTRSQRVESVCDFLRDIEEKFSYMKLFHAPDRQIPIDSQYISIEVTLERRFLHEVEDFHTGYAESEEELKRAYALKGTHEDEQQPTQVPWEDAKKKHPRLMVLADPGMGKTTMCQRRLSVL
ncbi:hypothetical protein IH992_19540 [Candidatus Poribacteria bacterium]|nr:hypothetical protein [Candidatus Poribacteria bacterium]